jgi:hypothetical protein
MKSEFAVILVLAALVMALGITSGCVRYRECRAHGFSRFYCLTQK